MKIKRTAMPDGRQAGERGFLRLILIVVILLLVVSYFGINLRQLVNSPTTQDNVSYVSSTSVNIWNSYLKGPATTIWNFFIQYVWSTAVSSLKNGSLQLPSAMPSTTPNTLGGQPAQ